MDQDIIDEQYKVSAREYWRNRVNAPADVFNALVEQYVEACKREKEALDLAQAENEHEGEASVLDITVLQPDDGWYCNDLVRLEAAIHKLSRGFSLTPDRLKLFFSEALPFHRDVHDALNTPDTPMSFYPNSVHYTAICIVKMMEPYLRALDDKPEDETLTVIRNDPFTGQIPIEYALHNNALFLSLEQAQNLEKTMPIVAAALRENRYHNLATVIDHLGRKGAAMSRDIIARAQTQRKPS